MINNKQLIKDHMKITQLISQGNQLDRILSIIIESIEKRFQDSQVYTFISKVDPNRNELVNLAGSPLSKDYISRFYPMKIEDNEGVCGLAAFLKETIIVPHVEKDKRWDKYRSIADQIGFKASWSIPILSSTEELLGVFSIYYKNKYEPDIKTMQIIEKYNQLVAIALEISKNNENIDKHKRFPLHGGENKQMDNMQILSQLKNALKKEEFEVYYQPYYGVKSKEVGIEALIRWNHPNNGLLPPAAFLDVAETSGLIIDMEKWVLNQAILEANKLQRKGVENLTLSVNISANQFDNKGFPNIVAEILELHSFKPENLTLEITERFLIKKSNIEIMKELKEIGVRISIDDFGTSYSSLQYLQDLPIDELKIDRSFISDIESNVNNRKIAEMIIMLGHQLDLTIVGEGVETENQLKLLKEMNCDRVQGFLFSKPVPLKMFVQKHPNNDLMMEV